MVTNIIITFRYKGGSLNYNVVLLGTTRNLKFFLPVLFQFYFFLFSTIESSISCQIQFVRNCRGKKITLSDLCPSRFPSTSFPAFRTLFSASVDVECAPIARKNVSTSPRAFVSWLFVSRRRMSLGGSMNRPAATTLAAPVEMRLVRCIENTAHCSRVCDFAPTRCRPVPAIARTCVHVCHLRARREKKEREREKKSESMWKIN